MYILGDVFSLGHLYIYHRVMIKVQIEMFDFFA
jgi:hypothetical protein